jgi:hypothetical protein
MNREQWLTECGLQLKEVIEDAAARELPPFLISTGFPSRNALSTKRRSIGQCWDGMVSNDGKSQLFISPVIANNIEVAATVAHELVHATVGVKVGHRGRFVKVVRAIGLEGLPTKTFAGKQFIEIANPIIKKLGPYPHSELVASSLKKPQVTRLKKVQCDECGYIARVTSMWLTLSGPPICPTHEIPMTEDEAA